MDEADRAMQLAEALGKPGDMIAAVRLKPDLNRLITKQTESGKPGEFDALTDAELAAKEEPSFEVQLVLDRMSCSRATTASQVHEPRFPFERMSDGKQPILDSDTLHREPQGRRCYACEAGCTL